MLDLQFKLAVVQLCDECWLNMVNISVTDERMVSFLLPVHTTCCCCCCWCAVQGVSCSHGWCTQSLPTPLLHKYTAACSMPNGKLH